MSQPFTTPVVPSPHSPARPGFSFSNIRKWLYLRPGLPTKLWTTFALGTTLIFTSRISLLLPGRIAAHMFRGEYYHFRIPLNKAFLWVHLAAILPAAALAVTQFVPRIRARAMGFHRTAGKVINTLTFVSTLTAWGITRVSFGGELATQSGLYALGAMTLWSTVKSWTAIRRLQIDEHRTWVIRAWSYQMSIVTLRLVFLALMLSISAKGGFYQTVTSDEVEYVLNDAAVYARDYPQCQIDWPGARVTHVSIEASVTSNLGLMAVSRLAFGTSTWVGLLIHAIGAEYYLYKTKDESDRLREISTKRQNVRRMSKAKEGDKS